MCPKCKTKVDRGAQYCSNCGITLNAEEKKKIRTALLIYWLMGLTIVVLMMLLLQRPSNETARITRTNASVNTGDVYTALTIKARYRDNAVRVIEALKGGDCYLVLQCGEIKPSPNADGAAIKTNIDFGDYQGSTIYVSSTDIFVYCPKGLLEKVKRLQVGDYVKILVSFYDYRDNGDYVSFAFEAKDIEPSSQNELDSTNLSFGITNSPR